MNNSLAAKRLLAAARRQWWVVLQAMIIVGLIAGWSASRSPIKPFATASAFLVKPVASDGSQTVGDLQSYYRAQTRLLKGETLANAVAAQVALPGIDSVTVLQLATVSLDLTDGSAVVVVKGEDPAVIQAIANAYGPAYASSVNAGRSDALNARSSELSAAVDAAKLKYDELAQQIAVAALGQEDTGTLEADKNFYLEQYKTLSAQYQTLLTDIASQPKVIEPISGATEPVRPAQPSVKIRGAIGAVVGIMFGIGLAWLRELLDGRLRDAEAATEVSGVAVVAEIPRGSKVLNGTLPVVVEPNRSLAEAVRSLRTTVRFLGVTEPIRSVAITSPAPGDGKSLVAANLAAAFALSGTSTVLVSGDLRRPSIDVVFAATSDVGLSDLLLAKENRRREMKASDKLAGYSVVNAEDYLVETSVPGLRLLPAGTPCPNPAELLASHGLPDIIKDLIATAEMVIIDCPPAIVADAVVLAKAADGALLVTSLNRSKIGAIRSATNLLGASRVNLLGVVVNRSSSERRSTYGSYTSYRSDRVEGATLPPAT